MKSHQQHCENNNQFKMYVAQNFFLRASIVLCMTVAVVTIIYFTPTPDDYYHSCDRPCHALDWPMICRVKLVIDLENKKISSTCANNSSKDNCTEDNNQSQSFWTPDQITVNGQFPGPAIHVCQNDVLVVDVVNKLEGNAISLHWRGQPQEEAPFMDGTPMITQCPITSFTTFQYRFRVSKPGTHLWHAFAHSNVARGVYGALIVRKASEQEEQKKLYDHDEKEHVLVISTGGGSQKLLINGQQLGASFNVTASKRYRFRLGYISARNCLVSLSVEDHLVKVISLDGTAIMPYEASVVQLAQGERLDFVVKAKRPMDSYKIGVRSQCEDVEDAEASLRYSSDGVVKASGVVKSSRVVVEKNSEVVQRVFTTGFCGGTTTLGHVCSSDVHALEKLPKFLRTYDVDQRFYLSFDSLKVSTENDGDSIVYRMNNITFLYPSSPLLTQLNDVPENTICNPLRKPEKCQEEDFCECVHVEDIILGSTVEIILIDQGGHSSENIFHIHGNAAFVMATRQFDRSMTENEIRDLDSSGALFKRNYISPILKDTIRVPKFGVVAMRFVADNPGFWMLRDEFSTYWTRGMDIVFRVGTSSHLVATPTSFPTCGNWIGPAFSL